MELNIEQALQQALAAHKEGKLLDAKRLYRAILQSQPQNPDANHNLGVLEVSANKADAALPLFKTALEANPKIEQFWLSYIDALIKEQKFENAKQVFEQAKTQGVNSKRLQALQAKIISLPQTENGHSSHPSQQQLNSLLGNYQNGRFVEAERLALSMTNEYPAHPFGWKVLSAILKHTGRITESLSACQKVVELSPEDAEAHSNFGAILQDLGRLEKAEVSYRHAIGLKPEYAEAHSNLGNTLKELGRLDEAEVSYTRAIAFKPDFAEAHSNLGNILKELGRLDEAVASYTQSITFKPDFAEAHYNLGIMLEKLGRLDEAETSYRQAISLKPGYAEAHNNLGNTLKELGRFDEAETSYTQAIALKPDYALAYNNLGNTLQKLNRLKEAKASYIQAIELDPELLSAQHMLAALTGETTATAPRDYVEGLFDNYAANFESSLVDKLKYKIPRAIAEMIIKDSKSDLLGSIVDLGCGTGLFGMEIKQFCNHLEGIDLSEKMLDEAKKKDIYNKLIKEDILVYLSKSSLNFDYFVSTDVFIYIGDLSDIFKFIKSRNKTRGKLVFSTEDYDGDGFFLERSGRYSHSKKYIESLCKKFGYKLRHFETQDLRKDKNQFIRGGLYILDF